MVQRDRFEQDHFEIRIRQLRFEESPIRGFWSYWAELMGVEAEGGIR